MATGFHSLLVARLRAPADHPPPLPVAVSPLFLNLDGGLRSAPSDESPLDLAGLLQPTAADPKPLPPLVPVSASPQDTLLRELTAELEGVRERAYLLETENATLRRALQVVQRRAPQPARPPPRPYTIDGQCQTTLSGGDLDDADRAVMVARAAHAALVRRVEELEAEAVARAAAAATAAAAANKAAAEAAAAEMDLAQRHQHRTPRPLAPLRTPHPYRRGDHWGAGWSQNHPHPRCPAISTCGNYC